MNPQVVDIVCGKVSGNYSKKCKYSTTRDFIFNELFYIDFLAIETLVLIEVQLIYVEWPALL